MRGNTKNDPAMLAAQEGIREELRSIADDLSIARDAYLDEPYVALGWREFSKVKASVVRYPAWTWYDDRFRVDGYQHDGKARSNSHLPDETHVHAMHAWHAGQAVHLFREVLPAGITMTRWNRTANAPATKVESTASPLQWMDAVRARLGHSSVRMDDDKSYSALIRAFGLLRVNDPMDTGRHARQYSPLVMAEVPGGNNMRETGRWLPMGCASAPRNMLRVLTMLVDVTYRVRSVMERLAVAQLPPTLPEKDVKFLTWMRDRGWAASRTEIDERCGGNRQSMMARECRMFCYKEGALGGRGLWVVHPGVRALV